MRCLRRVSQTLFLGFFLFLGQETEFLALGRAVAQSLDEALALTYSTNPTLQAARAQLRATDEGIAQAKSNYRPTVSASVQQGKRYGKVQGLSDTTLDQTSLSLDVSQPIFRGFRTRNAVRQATASILAGRESLRSTEQSVLFSAAQAYMDVISNTAIVALRVSDVRFLESEVRASRDRFKVGEGTRTDVSQAESELASAQSALNAARATLTASRAVYRQIVGIEPHQLSSETSISKFLPKTLEEAIALGLRHHPDIVSAEELVQEALYNVKTIEGELLPSATLEASVRRNYDPIEDVSREDSASIYGRVSIPLYQAGSVSSRVRQAKESLAQAEMNVDAARAQIRANVVDAWGQYQASLASILAGEAGVRASQLALEGVIEEQRVGQRTTQDVLDQQSDLVDAQVTLVQAKRDSIVAAYSLVSAIGWLDAETLGLAVKFYDVEKHYKEIKNKWFGLTPPSISIPIR